MTAASLLPDFVSSLRALFAERGGFATHAETDDLTDPEAFPDLLGTVCKMHGAARFLVEVPLVPCPTQSDSFRRVKGRCFPNSWTGVTSYQPATRGALRQRKMVVVRYCPECREAAERWFAAERED